MGTGIAQVAAIAGQQVLKDIFCEWTQFYTFHCSNQASTMQVVISDVSEAQLTASKNSLRGGLARFSHNDQRGWTGTCSDMYLHLSWYVFAIAVISVCCCFCHSFWSDLRWNVLGLPRGSIRKTLQQHLPGLKKPLDESGEENSDEELWWK